MKFLNTILSKFSKLSIWLKILIISIFIIILLFLAVIIWYRLSISPMSNKSEIVKVNIEMGSGSNLIADKLASSGVIRSKLAFKIYIKLNNVSDLQAGNYSFDKNMNLPAIIDCLKTGKVIKEQLAITFVEGKNIRWIAKKIASNTNNSEKDVFNLLKDTTYIDSLVDSYWFITDEVENADIYFPLEGYLFPDTYYFDGKEVSVKEIFKTMLDNMDKKLSKYKVFFEDSTYSVHDILTLASIVELEGINESSRKDIAAVFFNRIKRNISLGSDVTAYYAYNIDLGDRDLTAEELYSYNPYNTRGPEMFGKLPIGPIASPSLSSIEAVIYPNKNNYLYFVADKNAKVYFANTLDEHQRIVSDLKSKNLWYEY